MPSNLTETSTHASRNPSKRVQLKATRALQGAQRKIKKKALYDLVDEFYDVKKKYINNIVKDHHHTEEYALTILSNTTQYKQSREISMRNTIVHDLHKQAQDRGETMSLKDLTAAADEVAHLPRSKEEVARLRGQLQEKRELVRVGLRANNLSAGADSRAIVNRIQDEIMNLHTRTGTRCVALFTRRNVDDQLIPTYAESGGSFDFFIQSLKIAGLNVLRLFEQWSCIQDQARQRDSVIEMKREITQVFNVALHRMTKNKKLKMSYTNFDTLIKLAWKVKLVGWPDDIPFVKPSDLGSSNRVRRICSMVRSSQIHWVYLKLDEITELEADIERRHAAGTLHKVRKPRADKGKKHKSTAGSRRRKDADDEDDTSGGDNDDADESDEDNAPPATSSTRPAAPAVQSSSHQGPEAPPASSLSHQAALSTTALAEPITRMSDEDLDRLFPLDFDNLDYSNVPTVDYDSLVSGFGSSAVTLNDTFGVPGAAGVPSDLGAFLPSAATSTTLSGTTNASDSVYTSDALCAEGSTNSIALATSTSDDAGVLTSTGSAANGSDAPNAVRFCAPVTPSTHQGQKRKGVAGDRGEATKKARQSAGPGEVHSAASEKPKRKTRSDKGKPREKAVAVRAALENETPEQRDARLAAKKVVAVRKIQARLV
ncbi:hypothetical protein DFH08DRAFT_970000 [Mycena albidolilacea]|uniref:Uncharacterized protein n=1 Tax=Mycena albidolilacea TaxID=1033008 RepID=A0AAD6ZGS2_9AGAR|nr:hypothetical protein DFH08DRAFT_970000 [Mycena albidolilacea]